MKIVSTLLGSFAAALVAVAGCGGQSSSDSTPGAGATGAAGGSGGTGGVGGAGATSGFGGTSSTGGAGGNVGVIGECKTDEDCEMIGTCCDCVAGKKGSGVEAPPCDAALCEQDMCGVMGLTEARCIAGQCSIGANCDLSTVPCKSLPPQCPAGMFPTGIPNGCWGPCVPAQACAYVEDCFTCPSDTICVVNSAWTSSHHCVNPSPGCSGGCECLEPLVCIGGYTLCGELDDGSAAHCDCPSC